MKKLLLRGLAMITYVGFVLWGLNIGMKNGEVIIVAGVTVTAVLGGTLLIAISHRYLT